ncbi:MAG: hypothetical protein LC732_07370, partial [Acidobacteria bacterium]|nr:hypothetical protein [Acidobacteriota bacterium]
IWASSATNSNWSDTYFTSVDCDIIMEVGLSGSVFEEVLAHEIGHCLGFRHSNEPNSGQTTVSSDALMRSSVSGIGANLRQWDRDGANHVYGTGTPTCTLPTITTQPVGASITEGGSHSMSVAASGTTPFSYQWRLNGAAISGATSASYNTGALNTAGTYTYSVVVSNSCGSVTSNNATVTVTSTGCTAPSITSHPQGTSITAGQSHSMSVGASGTTPFSYQWRLNGNPLSGATSSSYNTGALNAGTYVYSVVVTNSCGNATSNNATVTVSSSVCTDPAISQHPASQTIISGQSASLSFSASGSSPLSVQWYRGNIQNTCGIADSNTATVTVQSTCQAPAITAQPQSTTIQPGADAVLGVSATGTGLQYQWFRGASGVTTQPVAGATAPTFSTGALQTTTQFWVRVSNSCGSRESATATVTVQTACQPPAITLQPPARTINYNASATLTVGASGSAPLSIQWYRGFEGDPSNPIAGANGLTFNTGSLTATTRYFAHVSNACGAVNTKTITVTVKPPPRRRAVRRG